MASFLKVDHASFESMVLRAAFAVVHVHEHGTAQKTTEEKVADYLETKFAQRIAFARLSRAEFSIDRWFGPHVGMVRSGYYLFVGGKAVAYESDSTLAAVGEVEAAFAIGVGALELFLERKPSPEATANHLQTRLAERLVASFEPVVMRELGAQTRSRRRARRAKRRAAATSGAKAKAQPGHLPPSAVESTDPYVVLGVAREASLEEIKRRHRQLCLEHHPDKYEAKGSDYAAVALRRTSAYNRAFDMIRRQRGEP